MHHFAVSAVGILLACGLVLAIHSCVSPAGATPLDPPQPSPPSDHGKVMIVWVGDTQVPELVELFRELLTPQGSEVRFSRERTLSAQRVLGEAPYTDPAVWVFVAFREPDRVDLYFRGRGGQRFLLRELRLPEGLDAVGRELVAQVVESSVTTLQRTDAGMSRDQARDAMDERHLEGAREEELVEAPTESLSNSARTEKDARSSTAMGWLALRYAEAWTGSQLGVLRSLGGELGASFGEIPLLRLRVLLERGLPRTIDTELLEAKLVTTSGWVMADAGLLVSSGQAVMVGVGLGLEATRIHPQAALDASITPAAARTNWVPASRLEARYRIGVGDVAAGLSVFATVPVLDTHYDLQREGGPERVAEPPSVIPGAALVLAWTPRLERKRELGRSTPGARDTGM